MTPAHIILYCVPNGAEKEYSLYIYIERIIADVKNACCNNGKWILKNNLEYEQPSVIAASSIVFGMEAKYLEKIIIETISTPDIMAIYPDMLLTKLMLAIILKM